MPYLDLRDGLPLYYERRGAGPTIVLVPGWTITTRFFERQIEVLADSFDVVTLDLRGAGNSGRRPRSTASPSTLTTSPSSSRRSISAMRRS